MLPFMTIWEVVGTADSQAQTCAILFIQMLDNIKYAYALISLKQMACEGVWRVELIRLIEFVGGI